MVFSSLVFLSVHLHLYIGREKTYDVSWDRDFVMVKIYVDYCNVSHICFFQTFITCTKDVLKTFLRLLSLVRIFSVPPQILFMFLKRFLYIHNVQKASENHLFMDIHNVRFNIVYSAWFYKCINLLNSLNFLNTRYNNKKEKIIQENWNWNWNLFVLVSCLIYSTQLWARIFAKWILKVTSF